MSWLAALAWCWGVVAVPAELCGRSLCNCRSAADVGRNPLVTRSRASKMLWTLSLLSEGFVLLGTGISPRAVQLLASEEKCLCSESQQTSMPVNVSFLPLWLSNFLHFLTEDIGFELCMLRTLMKLTFLPTPAILLIPFQPWKWNSNT